MHNPVRQAPKPCVRMHGGAAQQQLAEVGSMPDVGRADAVMMCSLHSSIPFASQVLHHITQCSELSSDACGLQMEVWGLR